MTRRIVLALLALTAAVLVGAVVPLALQAVAHERDAFINAAEATAALGGRDRRGQAR